MVYPIGDSYLLHPLASTQIQKQYARRHATMNRILKFDQARLEPTRARKISLHPTPRAFRIKLNQSGSTLLFKHRGNLKLFIFRLWSVGEQFVGSESRMRFIEAQSHLSQAAA